MCGGISSALGIAHLSFSKSRYYSLKMASLYNIGRVFSYSVAGALFGVLGDVAANLFSIVFPLMRIFAGIMMIALGLYLSGWWRGLTYVESIGNKILWQRLRPLTQKLTPISNYYQAILLGMLWGWLPCGLVYSVLTLAIAGGDWQQSALTMLGFGLGTMPVMLLTGSLAQRVSYWIRQSSLRLSAAMLIIAFGLWTIVSPISHLLFNDSHELHASVAKQ